MDEQEVRERGYATNMEKWWFLYKDGGELLQSLIRSKLSSKESKELEQANKSRDAVKIVRLMNQTWWRLPDSPNTQHLPCFGLLCDLCSDFPHGVE